MRIEFKPIDAELAQIYQKLVEGLAIKIHQDRRTSEVLEIDLKPLERVGWSGARVFRMTLTFKDHSKWHLVAKFGQAVKIESEFKKLSSFYGDSFPSYYYSEERKPTGKEMKTTERGAYAILSYFFVADAREFREIYLDDSVSDKACISALGALYRAYDRAHPTTELCEGKRKICVLDDYRSYVDNRSSKPLARLRATVDYFEHARTYGAENPVKFFYDELKPTEWGRIQVPMDLVHGDFHARNGLLVKEDKSWNGTLIDFAWAHRGHKLKDYTLMEATIKFMLLSDYHHKHENGYISHEEYIGFEKQLVAEGLELSSYEREYNPKSSKSLRRAFKCIKVIRSEANRILKNVTYREVTEFETMEAEYFMSLFLVSLGNVAYPEVEETWLLHGCGLLVPELRTYFKRNGAKVK